MIYQIHRYIINNLFIYIYIYIFINIIVITKTMK